MLLGEACLCVHVQVRYHPKCFTALSSATKKKITVRFIKRLFFLFIRHENYKISQIYYKKNTCTVNINCGKTSIVQENHNESTFNTLITNAQCLWLQ